MMVFNSVVGDVEDDGALVRKVPIYLRKMEWGVGSGT